MNGIGNDYCTHQRFLRVTTAEYVNDAVFKCESCNRQYGVTLSDVTMKTISSSSSSHTMEVDVNSTQETNVSSAHHHQTLSDVTMKTVSSASHNTMEVDVTSTESSGAVGERNHNRITTSRLADEFDDLNEKLGQGGFGSVSKYRKKSDGKLYAIKKTGTINDGRDIKEEVEALSKLDHENIVRYYSCWNEPYNGEVILHIQMDFCEKGTIRGAIKSRDLALNRFRMWKLFRQIVEGIKYFHANNFIHRDLKPDNIFLSSNDCVKIGDFGVATSNTLRSKPNGNADISRRRNVLYGTDLYYAHEIPLGEYDNKVDMYSLGIIFFEMCSEPLKTDERRGILTELRKPEINIPPSSILPLHFQDTMMSMNYFGPKEPVQLTKNMVEIIKRLLDHDPSKRFSAEELLKSSIMHPPLFDKQPEFFQFVDFLLRPQFNPYSEYYQLMGRCLNQTTSEGNILKWLDVKENSCDSLSRNDSLTLHRYPFILEKFFKRCIEAGAQYFQPATLFPKMSIKEDYRSVELKQLATVLENDSSRSFVDKHGTLTVLPVDSHTPFAHHVASYNIKQLKRYCVNHVYTSCALISPPPEPVAELAFDVVSPPSSSLRQADAEVLQVFHKVLQDFSLSSCVLQLNHHSLLKAVFVHCEVPENQHAKACSLLVSKLNKIRNRVDGYIFDEDHHQLNALFPPESLELVLKLLKVCGDLNDVKTTLASFPGWNGSEAAKLADEAFSELVEIINIFQNQESSSTCQVSINLNTGIEYYRTHSGFLFSFIHQSEGFFHGEITELVKGGRYDGLVQSFRNVVINRPGLLQVSGDDRQKQHVTGGAIYVNSLLSFIEKD